MKEYRIMGIGYTFKKTEQRINDLTAMGWVFLFAYGMDKQWWVFERTKGGNKK